MEILQGKRVTHKNKHYDNGAKFTKDDDGDFLYFSKTYDKWMLCNFTPYSNIVEIDNDENPS